jgi:hypothetical protein
LTSWLIPKGRSELLRDLSHRHLSLSGHSPLGMKA